MPSRGDITASEVFADREMLNRLGYGIFDVTFGKDEVGFENVKDFSYVVAQDEDPKLYRRKVFGLIGRYYPNDLAKAMWNKFIDHKWVLSEQAGKEIDLRTAAIDWFNNYSHQFLKEWTFKQPEVPNRVRNQSEPSKGMVGLMSASVSPSVRELLNAGFSIVDIARAAIVEAAKPGHWKSVPLTKSPRRRLKLGLHLSGRRKLEESGSSADARWKDDQHYLVLKKLDPAEVSQGRYYVRLLANLTGHEPKTPEEAERRWTEILDHKWYMSERAGQDVGIRAAAIDYFRRLNLLQEAESGYEL